LIRRLQFETVAPWVLLIIAILTYGLLIKNLGLYWDDFPYTWFGHVLGTTQYQQVFYSERPVLTILYNITAPVFGENILSWQIFAILLRWFSALCVGWIIRLIWPGKKEVAFVISLLFLVYPGFGQQWISTISSRTFILLCFFLLSLIFMAKSLRTQKRHSFFLGLSLLFGTISLLGSEYFFGLEFSRPVIQWIIISSVPGKFLSRLKSFTLNWFPYLTVAIVFSIWRGLYVQTQLYSIDITQKFGGSFWTVIHSLVSNLLTNAFMGGILAWVQTFSILPQSSLSKALFIIKVLMMGSVFCLISLIWWKYLRQTSDYPWTNKIWRYWQFQGITIGLMMLLIGSLPFWVADLPFELNFPYDRFTLPMMFGSGLVLAGFIYLIPIKYVRWVVVSLIVTLSAGWHFQTANLFRVEWYQMGNFLQQLTWRIPAMKPDTMLVAYELPFKYYSDNSITAIINWIYAPNYKNGDLPFVLDYLTVRKNSVLEEMNLGSPVTQNYRSLVFHGNISNILVIYKPERGCLKILDSEYSKEDTIPKVKVPRKRIIKLSNLDRIITKPKDSAIPIPVYFSEPVINPWCYYYEKADLARQTGNFSEIVKLWDDAEKQSLEPLDPSEYLPFIEGWGFQNNLLKAVDFSKRVNKEKPSMHLSLCNIWGRIESGSDIGESEKLIIDKIEIELRCNL
jgi:hypothetical protein